MPLPKANSEPKISPFLLKKWSLANAKEMLGIYWHHIGPLSVIKSEKWGWADEEMMGHPSDWQHLYSGAPPKWSQTDICHTLEKPEIKIHDFSYYFNSNYEALTSLGLTIEPSYTLPDDRLLLKGNESDCPFSRRETWLLTRSPEGTQPANIRVRIWTRICLALPTDPFFVILFVIMAFYWLIT